MAIPKILRWLFTLSIPLVAMTTGVSAAPREIRMGGLFDLSSGPGMQWGTSERNGVELAVEQFGAAHPEVKVRLRVEDSGYSNQQAVSGLQKLSSVDGTKYFIGPTWEPFVAVIPVCEARRLICIAPSDNDKSLRASSRRYVFTLWFSDGDYGGAHAEFMNSSSYQRVALVASISPYFDALVEEFLARIAKRPLTVERVLPEERDFRTLISKLPPNLDAAVVFLGNDGPAQTFFRQFSELRKERPDFFVDDAILFLNPPAQVTRYGFKIRYSFPRFTDARLAEFEADYQRKFGERPATPSGSVAYDAAMLLLGCAAQFDPDVDRVQQCLATTRGYQGASGIITFGPNRTVEGRGMDIKELVEKN
jgi:branched-chain amino acid transport system substrate-binding protein